MGKYLVRKLFLLSIILSVVLNFSVNVSALSASSAVVLDPQTNEILFELNANEQMSMASTTKLMTSLIALEYIEENSNEIVLITDEMSLVEGSSLGLVTGDKISLYDLVVGMLLPSGNDAANSVALYIAGSFEEFAVLMNEKAQEYGMVNTNFVTPSGLDAENHYSTAYDMALLMSHCIQNENMLEIMGSESMTVNYYSVVQQSEIQVGLSNHNKLLSYYEYCTGGKTGYTSQSGRCLVTCANENAYPLICVTFNAADDWNDHITLYSEIYDSMQSVIFENTTVNLALAEGGTLKVDIPSQEIYSFDVSDIERKIFLPKFLYYSSYANGETIGYIRYYEEGRLVLEQEIIKE